MAKFGERIRSGKGLSSIMDWMPVSLDYQNSATAVYYVVVGGGGAGGTGSGGNAASATGSGGGGGGYRTNYGAALSELSGGSPGTLETYPLEVTGGTNYTITIGAGGTYVSGQGGQGSSTVFGSITCLGGGGGGGYNVAGGAGGSGGGGNTGGAGTSGQGFAGGSGASTNNVVHGPHYGRGGGGAGEVGSTNGGAGRNTTITGTSTGFAGGGAGYQYTYQQPYSGLYDATHGGGGRTTGFANNYPGATAGSQTGGGYPRVNSGGGGGGSGYAGGSGIVIIRYANTFDELAYIDAGLVYSLATANNNYVYTFTAGTGVIRF